MSILQTAKEVKSFLKENGFLDKVVVRKSHNPFGGEDKWQVALAEPAPANAAIASKSTSQCTRFFSNTEGVEYVGKLNEINRICKENVVNAFAVDRII